MLGVVLVEEEARVEDVLGFVGVAAAEPRLLSLTPATERGALVLELFGAKRFIPAQNEDYAKIEAVGRQLGKIR